MPKCHVRHFISLYRAILNDVALYEPTLRLDTVRDMSRIVSSSSAMGHQVFLVHLPNCRKILDQALSTGRLGHSGIPFMKGYKNGSPIPRLFKGIWLRIFEQDGCLKQDVDPNHIFFLRTLLSVGKKYEMECPPSALYETTEDFYVTDQKLPIPSLDWDSVDDHAFDSTNLSMVPQHMGDADQQDLFRPTSSDDAELLDTLQRVADHVSLTVGLIDTAAVRHGPGAVADNQHGVHKYAFTRWNPRLEPVFPYIGTAVPLGHACDWLELECPSQLLAVPKTLSAPRLIAKEPVDNVFCQFALMDGLYSRVAGSWIGRSIDFRSQRPSQEGALEGSRLANKATIDLSSASDRVSLWLIERLFRKNQDLLWKFRSCRTGIVDLTIDKKLPSLLRLRKFSTQGSALTFPVQSLVFLMICIAAGLRVEGLPPTLRNVKAMGRRTRIFGDDIIVPVDWFVAVKTLLEMCHLKVNAQKSHYLGSFRESCGVDAWAGYDVTPPYVKRFGDSDDSATAHSVIDTVNNFFAKGLWCASQYILSTLPRRFRENIPVEVFSNGHVSGVRDVVADSGCLNSFSGRLAPPRKRWNPDLQSEEWLALTLKVKHKPLKADGSLLLRAFLGLRHRDPLEPSFEGIEHWYPWSRKESHAVSRVGWVPQRF